jgi:hypothetical protein
MKQYFKTSLLFTFVIAASTSCNSGSEEKETISNPVEVKADLVKKPESWIKDRVEKAEKKLNSTEGGKLVWQCMEAHGGLENWFNKGGLSFRFDYVPLGDGTARKTISQIDTWSNKAVHQDVLDNDDTFGWDGENAWLHRNDTLQFPYDVRFWALTPYYFLGQPFIFDGDGVKIEKIADDTLSGVVYDAVKITFEAGTGDAPDDYYINLYDKETHLLNALKYIVSYPSYFKDGGHSPEKTMVLFDQVEVDGIKLPTRYETYKLSEVKGELGEKVTDVQVSQISFLPNLENSYFDMPQGAELVK